MWTSEETDRVALRAKPSSSRMGLTSASMTLVAVGMKAKEFNQWVVSSESGSFWRMSWAIRETEASVEMVGRASWKNFLQLLITIN